jgi:hypothetical protein
LQDHDGILLENGVSLIFLALFVIYLFLGQNLMEIFIESGIYSENIFKALANMGIIEEPSTLCTFFSIQFFNFETQITPISNGMRPRFAHTFQ